MSRFVCAEPGCNRGPKTSGHAIYRTSEKGEAFVGKCEIHYGSPLDQVVYDVTKAFELK